MFDLSGKVAVVTGSSSGIGAEAARQLARSGARVVLVGRDSERLEAVRSEIWSEDGDAFALAIDITNAEASSEIVAATVGRFGRLDILVLAAGVFIPAPLADLTFEDMSAQWATNVWAPIALTRDSLSELKRNRGRVIFVSSTAGQVGASGVAAYSACKGAVELATKSLAAECAPMGVRVNAVAPGNVRTPMNDHVFSIRENREGAEAMTPAGRIGAVNDIAPAIVYLASDEAAYVHGHSLVVDGGLIAI